MNLADFIFKKDLFVSRKGIIISFCIMIIFYTILQIGMIKIWNHSGEVIVDLKTNYTPEIVYDTLTNMGDYSRGIYSYMNIVDFTFPFFYSMFFFTSIGYMLKKSYPGKTRAYQFMFVPFIVGLFDLMENVCIAYIINEFPNRFDNIVRLANQFTIGKNIALVITVIIFVGSIFIYFKKK